MHVGPAARPRNAAQLALAAASFGAAATMSAATFGAAEQAATDARRPSPAVRRPVRRVPADLSPGRLKGSYVGVLGNETLVLTLAVPADGVPDGPAADGPGADAVLVGTLNRNAREPVTLEVLLEGGRGLAQRPLPGLGVSFGAVLEDADGRLWIALVADDGRVAAELSEIKTKSGGK